MIRRREIIQYVYQLIFECLQLMFSQTYISVTFLMIYGTMWALNVPFNTHFFAVASCLLAYMRTPIVEFFSIGVKAFVNFLAAQKRIQVCEDEVIHTAEIEQTPIDISSS